MSVQLENAIKNFNNKKLEKLFDVNALTDNSNLIHIAAKYNNMHAVRFLAERGVDLSMRLKYPKHSQMEFKIGIIDLTPLLVAIINNNKEFTSLLLDKGAKFTYNCKDIPHIEGYILMFLDEEAGLQDKGKIYAPSNNPNLTSNSLFNVTAYYDIIIETIFWVVPLFVEKGYDINLRRGDSGTLLAVVLTMSNVTPIYKSKIYDVVSLLLAHGIDPNIPGKDGKYALDIALENERHDIVTLLLKNGANNTLDIKHCKVCCKTNTNFYRCAGCDGPGKYCSRDCQKIDWKSGHREQCKQKQSLMSDID